MDLGQGRAPRNQGRQQQNQQHQFQQFQAFVAQTTNQQQQRAKDDKCFECGQSGHYARNCPQWNKGKARIAQVQDQEWEDFQQGGPSEFDSAPDKLTSIRTQIAALSPEEFASLRAEDEGESGFQQA